MKKIIRRFGDFETNHSWRRTKKLCKIIGFLVDLDFHAISAQYEKKLLKNA